MEKPKQQRRSASALHAYRVPILVSFLMVVALAFWGLHRWAEIQEFGRERLRRHASGVLDTLEATLRSPGYQGQHPPEEFELILENLVQNSPLQFIIIERDGLRVLQTSDAPPDIALSGETGDRLTEEIFLIWRKIRLPGDSDTGHVYAMALALELIRKQAMLKNEGWGLVLTLVLALLLVGMGLAAWIMTIRNRLLAAELDIERTNREHLEDLGLAAAGLAHETKNPLGIILGLAQQIANNPDEPAESRVMVEHIMDEVDKTTARLGDFMAYAREREIETSPLSSGEVLGNVTDILRPDFDAAGVELEKHCDGASIMANAEMLRQILVNLLLNSLYASEAGSTVSVRLERDENSTSLTVEDRGRGIDADLLPNIFKPYITGSPEGHGLGLAIVKRFADEHNWTIEVESKPGVGTKVLITGMELSTGRGEKA